MKLALLFFESRMERRACWYSFLSLPELGFLYRVTGHTLSIFASPQAKQAERAFKVKLSVQTSEGYTGPLVGTARMELRLSGKTKLN